MTLDKVLHEFIARQKISQRLNSYFICVNQVDSLKFRTYIHKALKIETLLGFHFGTLQNIASAHFADCEAYINKIPASALLIDVLLERILLSNLKHNEISSMPGYRRKLIQLYELRKWYDSETRDSNDEVAAIFDHLDLELNKAGLIHQADLIRQAIPLAPGENRREVTAMWFFPDSISEKEKNYLRLFNAFNDVHLEILTFHDTVACQTALSIFQNCKVLHLESTRGYSTPDWLKKNLNLSIDKIEDPVRVYRTDSLYSEASLVARISILLLEQKTCPEDITILYANSKTTRYLKDAFDELYIPYDLQDGVTVAEFGIFKIFSFLTKCYAGLPFSSSEMITAFQHPAIELRHIFHTDRTPKGLLFKFDKIIRQTMLSTPATISEWLNRIRNMKASREKNFRIFNLLEKFASYLNDCQRLFTKTAMPSEFSSLLYKNLQSFVYQGEESYSEHQEMDIVKKQLQAISELDLIFTEKLSAATFFKIAKRNVVKAKSK